MREIGAIQPCHTPQKNPAGLIEYLSSPGIQPVRDSIRISSNARKRTFLNT
jgi:hypothetical protein